MPHNLELLAPAGTVEIFETAVRSGADAIYIGAPMANARSLAKHFSYEEIAAMVSFAHENGVKLYVAMNSLVKNADLPSVIKSLAIFESVGVDALIMQDLGIYKIVKKYFPKLRLHASTLMCVHNSIAVKKMAEMGFERIVLAREMSVSEIKAAAQISHAQIEVFVHGAMCFSYSGLCLASSFLGGKSGLRGRCVQPCRRKYSWKGKHKGSSNGYFFSMNDLNGIHFVDSLDKAGVDSLKIEGRMRNVQYIQNVVKAYRHVIDNNSSPESLQNADEYLKQAMSRKTTNGFFSLPEQKDIISYQHSGNIGLYLGKVERIRNGRGSFILNEDLEVGDRIRIHFEGSGERTSVTVREIYDGNAVVDSADCNTKITIELPASTKVNDSIYKVDTAGSRQIATQAKQINSGNFKNSIKKYLAHKRIQKIIDGYSYIFSLDKQAKFLKNEKAGPSRRSGGFRKKVSNSGANRQIKPALNLWLKIDNFRILRSLPRNELFSHYVVLLTKDTLAQFKKSGLFGLPKKLVSWSLPPVIHEGHLDFYRYAISFLSSKGFTTWQLSQLGQLELFVQAGGEIGKSFKSRKPLPKNKQAKRPRVQRWTFHGNYTLNLINSLSLEEVSHSGFTTTQISIEADHEIISSLAGKANINTGITVFGYPALLTARASLDVFKTKAQLLSPKGEPFVLKESNEVTQVVAQEPFSLLEYLEEIQGMGVGYGVVDLTNDSGARDPFSDVVARLSGKKRHRRLSSFNYNGNLY